MDGGWGTSCEIALRWMPLDLTGDKSTLVQVMAWCPQATSHYLSQCWPRSMSPNGVTKPQWVNSWRKLLYFWQHYHFNQPLHPWWRHQMETFSALLAICAGNSPVTGEFPAQRPVTRNFDVFFDQRLNERLSKQSWGWLFETPSRPLWCHSNEESSEFEAKVTPLWFPHRIF